MRKEQDQANQQTMAYTPSTMGRVSVFLRLSVILVLFCANLSSVWAKDHTKKRGAYKKFQGTTAGEGVHEENISKDEQERLNTKRKLNPVHRGKSFMSHGHFMFLN